MKNIFCFRWVWGYISSRWRLVLRTSYVLDWKRVDWWLKFTANIGFRKSHRSLLFYRRKIWFLLTDTPVILSNRTDHSIVVPFPINTSSSSTEITITYPLLASIKHHYHFLGSSKLDFIHQLFVIHKNDVYVLLKPLNSNKLMLLGKDSMMLHNIFQCSQWLRMGNSLSPHATSLRGLSNCSCSRAIQLYGIVLNYTHSRPS